jgi:serine/threonine-protein kinase
MIGTRLAHYEITMHLGSGGMGDVYQAADTKLDRSVAIKFLPEAFSHDGERVARFQREARVLASLNHPNIAAIYGVEETGGRHFLVMELVPGETLEDRIARGAIPLDEALPMAKQIAEAIEAAHEQGIIHRDLKPANIKIRPDGTVKVLDFGLAKAYEQEQANVSRSNSPTISMAATNAGVILGTAAYMSPEQAVGKHTDKRTDIWSFGVVLWEMLTGSRLFGGGETVSHTLADVLRAPIDFEKIPSPRLRELLRRCLDRDMKTRLRDIGEARVALSRAANDSETPARPAAVPNGRGKLWPFVAAALAISTAVAFWAPWRRQPERPLRRLEVELGPDVSLDQIITPAVVLSPDGTRLAYSDVPSSPVPATAVKGQGGGRGSQSTVRRLFVKRLDQKKVVELTDAANAFSFFFSPDSQWIAFYRNTTLYKISVEGGKAVPLADLGLNGGGGDWGEDGTIVGGGTAGLFRIPQGGKSVQLTKLESGERNHLWPRILPGGKAVLFTNITGPLAATSVVEAVSLVDGKRKEVLRGGAMAQYLPSGHLIYTSNGALYAVAFDPDKLETRGTAVSVLDDVQSSATYAQVSISNSGTLVYRKGQANLNLNTTPPATIDWINPSGKRSPLLAEPQRFSRLRFSPDGNFLAVLISDPDTRDYWVYDLRQGTRSKITMGDLSVTTVAWSPDSRCIFFGTGGSGIFWVPADGAIPPQRLLDEKSGLDFVTSYSSSVKRLAYLSFSGRDTWTLPLTEDNGQWKAAGPAEPFFPTPEITEQYAVFSPDGRWIAYSTDESGKPEVYVRPFQPKSSSGNSGQAKKWTISTNGGTRPNWSSDGRELLYQEGDRLMSVSYTGNGDTFIPGARKVRITKLGADQEGWDLAPDGRIAAVTILDSSQPAVAPPAEHTVIFLDNFVDEVKRRVK